eukprot:4365922-Amphidinium_carterae.1
MHDKFLPPWLLSELHVQAPVLARTNRSFRSITASVPNFGRTSPSNLGQVGNPYDIARVQQTKPLRTDASFRAVRLAVLLSGCILWHGQGR